MFQDFGWGLNFRTLWPISNFVFLTNVKKVPESALSLACGRMHSPKKRRNYQQHKTLSQRVFNRIPRIQWMLLWKDSWTLTLGIGNYKLHGILTLKETPLTATTESGFFFSGRPGDLEKPEIEVLCTIMSLYTVHAERRRTLIVQSTGSSFF